MYPATFFSLFPSFPRDNRVFVAMSFDDRFERRWTDVIAPAIRRVAVNEVPLEPHRVKFGVASDSILTEILDGIGRCRALVADISAVAETDQQIVRNGNVMYEVGLAHAVRLPEEVILLRSDNMPIMFDITTVRVHFYDPDCSPDAARDKVATLLLNSLKEVELKRNLAVRRAAQLLDVHSWFLLLQTLQDGQSFYPRTSTIGHALGSLRLSQGLTKLLELGALEAEFLKFTPRVLEDMNSKQVEELIGYRVTSFGSALVSHCMESMGLDSPELQELLKKIIEQRPEDA